MIHFSLTISKNVQHEAKKQEKAIHNHRRGDGGEKKSSELRQREKKARGLNLFSFSKLEGGKKEALDALCVFSFVLRQSFLSGPALRLGARRRSTYKRIDTNVLHLRKHIPCKMSHQ